MLIGIRRNVQHVFDPPGAVGHLHVHPICLAVFHSTPPIEVKTEDVFVKAIHSRPVVNDKSGMDDVRPIGYWLFVGAGITNDGWLSRGPAQRLDDAPFGIEDCEHGAGGPFRPFLNLYFILSKYFLRRLASSVLKERR
jgi:hypothetical protein